MSKKINKINNKPITVAWFVSGQPISHSPAKEMKIITFHMSFIRKMLPGINSFMLNFVDTNR